MYLQKCTNKFRQTLKYFIVYMLLVLLTLCIVSVLHSSFKMDLLNTCPVQNYVCQKPVS